MLLDKTVKILMPEYLEKFNCIGPSCEDTCCRGWTVALDQKTYKKYKNCGHHELKKDLSKFIARERKNQSEYNYGKIKMNMDGSCPFLDEEQLCKIHLSLDEDYLSNTCYFYPRHTNKINNLIESSASISCPEIARLALLNPEPMGFIEIQKSIKRPFLFSYTIEDTTSFHADQDLLYHFWDMRIFTIGVLQDRRYDFDERLLLLGLFIKRIIKLQNEGKVQNLPYILEEYQTQFNDSEEIKNLHQTHKDNIEVPFPKDFISQFGNPYIIANFPSQRYQECALQIIEGLKILEGNIQLTQEIYEEAYRNYYMPYIKQKEYILENYIVNEVFKELYPLARLKSIEESYNMLLTLYNMVKFHLIGIAAYYKNLNDEITIKLIQSFSRVILHHSQYLGLFISAS